MAALTKSMVEKWVALYVRLSRDDENEGDSNSIAHQRNKALPTSKFIKMTATLEQTSIAPVSWKCWPILRPVW